MSETKEKKFSINIAQYGGITVEAPTKEDCIDLFREASGYKRKSPLDEAIR
jgi:hypothetical protein